MSHPLEDAEQGQQILLPNGVVLTMEREWVSRPVFIITEADGSSGGFIYPHNVAGEWPDIEVPN
ncbi:hypothetical protein J2D78_01515 [Microbacterium maritypicum]|uniref:hypothetical protein n=1 Tax=Microbacterium maritypicum TaxID=33918 RepID=UPI001B335193|nr:hypothetical protein [Microbacterium liquefaciens]MBP5800752.1 hypothetical protein [Microbacterium liquefaciens]